MYFSDGQFPRRKLSHFTYSLSFYSTWRKLLIAENLKVRKSLKFIAICQRRASNGFHYCWTLKSGRKLDTFAQSKTLQGLSRAIIGTKTKKNIASIGPLMLLACYSSSKSGVGNNKLHSLYHKLVDIEITPNIHKTACRRPLLSEDHAQGVSTISVLGSQHLCTAATFFKSLSLHRDRRPPYITSDSSRSSLYLKTWSPHFQFSLKKIKYLHIRQF